MVSACYTQTSNDKEQLNAKFNTLITVYHAAIGGSLEQHFSFFSACYTQTSNDKEQRALLHRALRETFPSLESKTIDAEGGSGGKVIRVSLSAGTKGKQASMETKHLP